MTSPAHLPALLQRPRVGIVGGGQLARMTALAARNLDVDVTVLAPEGDAAVAAVGAAALPGGHDSLEALRGLAEAVDVVTFDHELVPPLLLQQLAAEGHVLRPAPEPKLLAQDKAHQRARLSELGFPVPPHRLAGSEHELREFAAEHGPALVLKSPRGGYDGRGIWSVESPEEGAAVLREAEPLLAEPRLALEREVAVLVARRASGEAVVYPVVETVQRDGMCRELLVPAPLEPEPAERARELGLALAEAIGAEGILAVELFVVGGELLVNELALRPHNSGHWTLGGAVTSQFENHVRAVLDWPLGRTDPLGRAVATVNVVGPADGSDPRDRRAEGLAVPGAMIHLYGKEARPGRKVGHVTVVADALGDARERARLAAERLTGEAL